ncbi:MAG: glycoside hydrolase family 43 protein [Cyclobacteriaceae bacterium]|nr:glycoside hydrolase family 43 protein [Cyclobacteriaceae bacterium]
MSRIVQNQLFSSLCFLSIISLGFPACSEKKEVLEYSGNPLFSGWYADPEGIIFDNKYWIYPTYSEHFGKEELPSPLSDWQQELRKNTINDGYLLQTFFDAFSSEDLVTWERHTRVLDIKDIEWAAYALWAPSIIRKEEKYYLFFGANDIQNDEQPGGIGIAVSDHPAGPFADYLGKPLIDKFYHGAQPIDQFVFQDVDGSYYLIYGGWRNCNIGRLQDDFKGFIPFEDGSLFKSITPEKYVEGPFMFVRDGKYYFMWSEGGWTGPDYSVAYAIGDSPFGPFERIGKVLEQDPEIATGAGHHSVINIPDTDDWYIIYHRRPLDTDHRNHRHTCIEYMNFDEDGFIKPVQLTHKGVRIRKLE